MRRRIGAACVALGAIVLVLSFTVAPAQGQPPDQVGWWYELKTKAVPVAPPAPPTVPDGGLYVQQGPGGPMAYGALRYRVPSAASATLTLTAAQGSTTTLGAPLQASATTASWVPSLPAPGYWEDAPTYGTTCTPGTVSTDGAYVAFLFGTPFVAGEVIDVAIVPTDGATPFAIAFDEPDADALSVKPAYASTPPPTSPPTTTASSGSTTEPVDVSPPFTVAPPSTPTSSAPAAQAPSVAQQVLHAVGVGDPDHGERLWALVGSSAIVVGWWLLSSRRSRMPRLVGALAGGGTAVDLAPATTTRIGGVGRFARTRDRNARALR